MKWPSSRLGSQEDKSFGMYEVAAEMQSQGVDDIIHLEVGRPSFDTPLHIKEATKKALDDGMVHYGDLRGNLPFREALAKKLQSFNNIAVVPDEVLVTNGLTQASFATFMAALDDGDEVIVLEPFYPQHNKKIELLGGKVVSVPLIKAEGFRLNPQAVEDAITDKTRMIVFVNPSNPVGRVFSLEEITALADIATRHDLLVFSDEVYEYVIYDERKHVSIASLPGMRERCISAFAFTKAYAMDGWRLGYVAAAQHFVDAIFKVTLNETTHPNIFAQEGGLAATAGSQDCVRDMVTEDSRRRDLVHRRLNAMPGITCELPHGSIYAFPDFSSLEQPSDELAVDLLKKTHVATEAGSFYGPSGDGHLRFCFGSEPYDRLEQAMDRIDDYLARR
jgi:aspartate aminotransferase